MTKMTKKTVSQSGGWNAQIMPIENVKFCYRVCNYIFFETYWDQAHLSWISKSGLGLITIDDYDYDYDYMTFLFIDYDYDYLSL